MNCDKCKKRKTCTIPDMLTMHGIVNLESLVCPHEESE